MVRFFVMLLLLFDVSTSSGSPFPVKGTIYNAYNQQIAIAHVYPQYVEIFTDGDTPIGRVGIMVENGIAKLFLIAVDRKKTLVGHASAGKIFNSQDQWIGSYFWTPTYSFVYNRSGARVGKVKCIAWPRVCAVGVGGYLLQLFR
ncbi:MAG: hypothetical protein GY786_13605 [Proteobacteria bacterium]|nr:hypothetical protein [Pseudomonadota bacterium]